MPKLYPEDGLAQTLQSLDGQHVLPTTARNKAYLVLRAIEYMTRACLREQANLSLVSAAERERALDLLVESIGRVDWATLGLDQEVTQIVVDPETIALIVHRISGGESLAFLEDLLYERFTSIDTFGATPTALSALRLPNYRRRRPPETLYAARQLRKLPANVGGKF